MNLIYSNLQTLQVINQMIINFLSITINYRLNYSKNMIYSSSSDNQMFENSRHEPWLLRDI